MWDGTHVFPLWSRLPFRPNWRPLGLGGDMGLGDC